MRGRIKTWFWQLWCGFVGHQWENEEPYNPFCDTDVCSLCGTRREDSGSE